MSNSKPQKTATPDSGIQIESRDEVRAPKQPNLETVVRTMDGFEIVTVVGVQSKVQWAD